MSALVFGGAWLDKRFELVAPKPDFRRTSFPHKNVSLIPVSKSAAHRI